MTFARGYRLLTGLALFALPACLSCSRPSEQAEFSQNPYSVDGHLGSGQNSASNRVPAPNPSPPAAANPSVDPLLKQTRHDGPAPVVPQVAPVAPTPRVELRPIEPNDPPESPLVLALRNFENRQPQQAVRNLDGCDRTHRELLANLLPLAVRLGDGSLNRADPQDVAAVIEQLNIALAPLRARAALEMPKLCFCRPLAAPARFGAYEQLEDNHRFRPGETVGLYMELKNFACLPHDSQFATHVASSVEIRDAGGNIVFRFDCERTEPSLSARQDYCHIGRFALPALPSGAYTLWLKATDVPTGRTARRSLDFRVASEKS